MKTVVLCGGKGTRLGLGNVPKAMAEVDGVPLLERLVRQSVAQGFDDFVFLAGHGSDYITAHFRDGADFGARITYVIETEPLGTAGCFKQVRELLSEPFLVLYGDVLIDVDLQRFASFALAKGGIGTLFVHPNDHPDDSDLVEVDENSRVIAFHPKPHPVGSQYPNLVNAALYVLSPEVLAAVPQAGASDWGSDIFPTLYTKEPLYAYRSCEYAKDIGTPDRIRRAEEHFKEGRVARLSRTKPKPAIFVDRDGVINEEVGGVLDRTMVRLIPGAGEAIHAINAAGVPAICVTNQPFLAKGQLSWTELRAIGGAIDHGLASAHAYLDDIRICPHHPERGWPREVRTLKIDCSCRKPQPGMLIEAAAFHNIDLARSWMIGDRYCDVVAGRRAGTKTALVRTGFGGADRTEFDCEPDMIFENLLEAATWIIGSGL